MYELFFVLLAFEPKEPFPILHPYPDGLRFQLSLCWPTC